ASFDVVTSIYGVMFAPDHRKTAAELARACRPGGKIALASWTPEGFIGKLFRLVAQYVPPTPDLTPPVKWGDEAHLRTLLGDSLGSIESRVRTAVFRFRTAEENVQFFRTFYGPTLKTFESLPVAKQDALAREMADLARAHDRNHGRGSIAITADYLESIIVR